MRSLSLALTLSALLFAPPAGAQTRDDASTERPHAGHAVFVEIGGSGLLYSLNYERRLPGGAAARVGGSFVRAQDVSVATLPLTLSWLAGRGAHRLELGGGLLIGRVRDAVDLAEFGGTLTTALATGTLGYRWQHQPHGMLLRVTLTPFVTGHPRAFPWAGLSVGYAF